MVDYTDVTNWLLNWFEKNTTAENDEFPSSLKENYFEKGWLDSFKFVSFIMEIEERFGISFSNDEFQNRKFSTIEGLSKIIIKRLEDKK